jgi:AAA+ superfamily predicted ATPase
LFLTTNRIHAIDPAFKSRIDLTLPYSDLDEAARRKVWLNFTGLLPPGSVDIEEENYNELAKVPMNGREIKNTIKTALVLAAVDRPFGMRHLRTILNIRKRVADFDLSNHHHHQAKRQRLEN